MDDNRIEIVARLDTSRSAILKIEADLSNISDKLNADKALKIIANIDLSKTTQRIQSQLTTISKNLKIDVPKIDLGLAGNRTGGSELINNVSHIVDDVEDKILELKQTLANEFGVSIDKIVTNTIKNARGQISSFSFDLTKLGGEVEKFNYTVNRKKDSESGTQYTTIKQTGSRDSDRGAIQLLKNQEAQVDKLTQKLEKLKDGFANVNAPRPILDEDSIAQLNEEFTSTDKIIKQIKTSTSETFDKMVSDANKAITKYESLGKALRDAENTATDFSSKDIGSAKSLLGGQIDSFLTRVSKSSVKDSQDIIQSAERIKESLNAIGDAQGLKTARDDFNRLKGEFNSLDAKAKATSFDETFKNKIDNLSAAMSAFAEKNERAVKSMQVMSNGKTFADEWRELSDVLSEGNLNPDELKHLQERFAILGKEAEAQGLKGKTAWEKFLGTFKTFSSYITANMVFNFVKRQLRDMVNEVVAVDTAMVELRKVTEATEADFEKFAKSAANTGRELGASISDVINATSTFSRAGFTLPEAEELGRIATLYKNVGDGIDIEGASESIISVMKAFNIEAEESERIIDRINNVSNNFAIDSGGLGDALKRVSSAMASANNTLDETIALTTVANEIVQDPVAVAQAWRTVSMRVRGAKAEIEAAGEDTEGMVESTAKLQSMIKGMTGVDIMVDADTFKSTYEIIKELGAVWDNLKDIEQAQLLEAIAGRIYLNVQKCA